MLIQVSMNRFGHLELSPVSERWARKFVRYLKRWEPNADGDVYIQEDYNVEAFLEENLSPSQQKDIRSGWSVTIRMDPWVYGHHLGWDAPVAEGKSC